jgi:chemotaxis protein methyltransferase CheR
MEVRAQRSIDKSAPAQAGADHERDFDFTSADFGRIRELIYQRAGIALSDHKRDMAYSRLARRLRACGKSSFSAYLDSLERDNDPDEWEAFTNALTTNLTAFFRESHHFPLLAEHVAKARTPVTVWCSAASTGEEPYSIAMTLLETLGAKASQATILATDLDTQVLAKGAAGVYTLDQVKNLSAERLRKFFFKGTGAQAGFVKVRPELRAMITFAQLNLTDTQWPLAQKHGAPFDVVFCRNVMIYFDKPTQGRILERFAPLMKPSGLLFAGHSENFTYVTRSFRLRGQTVYELAQDGPRATSTAPGQGGAT